MTISCSLRMHIHVVDGKPVIAAHRRRSPESKRSISRFGQNTGTRSSGNFDLFTILTIDKNKN
ncbi:hypothetical protein OUZ56_016380 [Daphnia magna]|uniref:Uncharacterized protein n=1 Tax=Daphnia magna TaxID=35525 RepID=A0ABR0AQG4_9CRUS|nr:hypothetical protein OUZ56_016380 [Daphnia magna]